MKTLCSIAAASALLVSATVSGPAMAQQITGGGATNLFSSAQGTSFSYGAGTGFANTTSGAMATVGSSGLSAAAASLSPGNMNQAVTMSTAGTSSNGGGYAQVQTSGYAGGSISTFTTRAH